MAGSKHILAINAAVMNCWMRCSESATPYVCVGDFLEKLRSMGWQEGDVQAVQGAVLPLLENLKTSFVSGSVAVARDALGPGTIGSGSGKMDVGLPESSASLDRACQVG